MVAPRHLSKPPIAEAAINLRLAPAVPDWLGDGAELIARLESEYPPAATKQQLRSKSVKVDLAEDAASRLVSADTFEGYQLSVGNLVVMMRRHDLLVSHVGAYDNFESLVADAKKAWSIYTSARPESQVVRIGLRYINRIPLQLPMATSDYFTAVPELPEELEQEIEGYMVRMIVPLEREKARANLVQVLEASVTGEVFGIIDIDVFGQVNLPVSDPTVWEKLESFRHSKNRFFFGLVTEKTLEPFL